MALYIGCLFLVGAIMAFILAKPDKAIEKLGQAEEALFEASLNEPVKAEELVYDARIAILDGCRLTPEDKRDLFGRDES